MIDPKSLARVKRAEAARRRAEDNLRAALSAAIDAGVSYADLARELGCSRQSVRERVMRYRGEWKRPG